jgi:YD repeat-containing protein
MKGLMLGAALAAMAGSGTLAAQQDTARARQINDPSAVRVQAQAQPMARAAATSSAQGGTPNYDVVLEVPDLSVDSIGLTVQQLQAHLALDANVARLVSLSAGADVGIGRVHLDLVGVQAEAYLYVDLDNVTRIANRVVTTLDRNPRILTQVLSTADVAVNTAGRVANTALAPNGPVSRAVGAVGQTLDNATRPGGLLSQTVNSLGQTVQRTLGTGGSILERTLDSTGRVLSNRTVGSVLSLPAVRETTNQAGQVVRQVRDQSGQLIELVLNQAGEVASARVIPGAGTRP